MQPGQAYLIQAFLKRKATASQLADRYQLPVIDALEAKFGGYVISWAEIDAADAPSFETLDLSTLTFDESSLLPPGVRRDGDAKLFMAGIGTIDVKFKDITSAFGHEGIGETIRGVLGDSIYLEGGQV